MASSNQPIINRDTLPSTPLVALVTGANGLSGEYLVRQLSIEPRWHRIIATSRRPAPISRRIPDPRILYAQADLNVPDANAVVDILRNIFNDLSCTGDKMEDSVVSSMTGGGKSDKIGVTHYFHMAYMHSPSLEEQYELNVRFFRNILIAVDHVFSRTLQRVILQTGGKYYGVASGPPPREPITEDLGRCAGEVYAKAGLEHGPPVFYYEQEDSLVEVQKRRQELIEKEGGEGKAWTWTTTRPFLISGFTTGSGQSFIPTAAIYFTMQKYLGEPAYFAPRATGDHCYTQRQDISSAKHIAAFTSHIATHPVAADQHYNIVDNTDPPIMFQDLWEFMGDYFGVAVQVRPGFDVEADIAEKLKRGVWKDLATKCGGDPDAPDKYATWYFFSWKMQYAYWSATVSVDKAAKETEWNERCDSLGEVREIFDSMKRMEIIPSIKG